MKAQSYSLPCLMTSLTSRKTHIPICFQLPFFLCLSFNLEKTPFCYFSFLHCMKASINSTMLSVFKFHLRLFLPTLPLIPCNLIPGNISVFSLPPQMHFVLLLFFSNSLSSVSRYSMCTGSFSPTQFSAMQFYFSQRLFLPHIICIFSKLS